MLRCFVASAFIGVILCGHGVAYAKWSLASFVDQMTGKTGQRIETSSTNSVTFRFPYGGPQHGVLTLRRHPRFGTDAFLSVPKGQFICGISSCDILVRFDDGEPVEYQASAPSDHSSNVLFLLDHGTFISNLLTAKVVRIEANFYRDGTKIFTFTVPNVPAPFLEGIQKDRRAVEKATLDARKREEQEQQDAIAHAYALADAERRRLGMAEAKDRLLANDWRARIQNAIKSRIVLPPNIEGNPESQFEVVLLPGGEVLSATLKKSSGNPAYDTAVQRAINRASPLPVPTDTAMFQENFRELSLIFRPKDTEAGSPSPSNPHEERSLMDQYRQMISARIKQYEEYPPIAKRRHWEGTTIVQLALTPEGKVASVTVLEKSGYDILDEAAIRMIQKASPLPLPPVGLRGRDQVFAFPVRFNLAE